MGCLISDIIYKSTIGDRGTCDLSLPSGRVRALALVIHVAGRWHSPSPPTGRNRRPDQDLCKRTDMSLDRRQPEGREVFAAHCFHPLPKPERQVAGIEQINCHCEKQRDEAIQADLPYAIDITLDRRSRLRLLRDDNMP